MDVNVLNFVSVGGEYEIDKTAQFILEEIRLSFLSLRSDRSI
ncbi:hypothetical protein J537_1423 [Acinetobacter baumannii 1437282]|jgi:hypothetical protein|nr:hypothetical protein J537_1423 [Acinetobacter baumannii 1437282]